MSYHAPTAPTAVDYLRAGRVEDAFRSAFYTAVPVGVAASYAMDTRAWDTSRIVRTYGDFLALARWAYTDAGAKVPALKASYAQMAGAVDRIRDAKGAQFYPQSLPLPTLFSRLRAAIATSPSTQKLVVAKAAEYYQNVEQKSPAGLPVPAPSPSFQPSSSVVVGGGGTDPAVLATPAPVDEPFYQKPWFAPVAVLTAVVVVAAVLVPRRG